MSKKLGRSGEMVSEKEEGVGSLASALSRAPFFSHCICPQFRSLPSSRAFLETPAIAGWEKTIYNIQ